MKTRLLCAFAGTTALFTLLASATAAPARADDPASQVLARSRAALGGDALDRVQFLKIESTVHVGGLSGTDRTWVSIGRLGFADFYDVPPIRGGDGYDGADAWNQDGSGLVWVDGGEAGRAGTIAQAFVGSYALWTPNRGGAAVTSLGTKSEGGHGYDVLRVAPPNAAAPFELWFDSLTHLPMRFVQTIGPNSSTTTYSQYRPVDGLMVPYVSRSESSDGNSSDSAVVNVVANPPDGSTKVVKPASNVRDFSIAGGSQTSIPFDLVENHVYLSLKLNGKGPYRFILDTGGANIVDPAVAKEIGAVGHGSIQGGGVGSTTESVSFANVKAMEIGAATVKDQLFGVAPTRLGFGVSGGQPVDGLIGFEVLARFITTFDYGAGRVVLAMPEAGSSPPAGADVVPFVLDGRQPQFACGIDGIATQCTVDTGARNSISLMAPFMAAHPEVVPQTLASVGVNGFGFGGASRGRLGRLRSLSFGTFTIPDVIGDFTTQTKGAFAAPFVAANVGGGVWKRFSLTLDYYKQTMALKANASFGDRDTYERAGLFLLNHAGTYVVLDVRPGTPAQRAGIVAGDAIDAIDGKPASSMSLQAVRQLFFGPPGTVLQIGLKAKDGSKRTVSLTLADII